MRAVLNFALVAAWFVLRQWRLRPWRTLAVVAGVGLGASVFLSVRLAATASQEAFARGMDAFAGAADLVAASPGGRVDDRLVGELLRDPAVAHAAPVLSAYASLPAAGEGGRPLRLVGVDPVLDSPFRETLPRESTPPAQSASKETGESGTDTSSARDSGAADSPPAWLSMMARPRTLLLGEAAARRLGLAEGSTLTLAHADRRETFTVLGVLAPEGLAGLEAGDLAVTDIATAQEFLELRGQADRIDLILAPGRKAADVNTPLPEGVRVGPPGEERRSGLAMIGAYQLNLTVLSFVSLFVGMFLVYSLVSFDAAARRRELAVMRSLGAGTGLTRGLHLFQGGLLGLLGWLAGMPLAALATQAMLHGVSATVNNLFVRVAVSDAGLDPGEAAASLAVTVGIAVLASLGPALRGQRVPPREALAVHAHEAREPAVPRSWTILGAVLVALAWPVCLLPAPAGFPLPGYAGIFLLFAGLSLLAPLAVAWVSAFFRPAATLGGAPARLAAGETSAGAGRTAVAVGALATAMALFLALSTMIHSFRAGFATWLDQTVTGDLFVRPSMAELNDFRDSLPDGLHAWLEARGDVEVLPYLRRYMVLGDTPFQFEATDMEVLLRRSRLIPLAALPDADELLRRGRGVAIAESLASQAGLKVGDRFQVSVGRAAVDVPVAAVVRSYRTRGGEAYFDLEAFRALGGAPGAGGLRVYFTDRRGDLEARADALAAEVQAGPWGRGLEAVSGAALHRMVRAIFEQTFALTGVLLVIALGVAALGVSVTLTVRVLERSGRLATLMALGASRGQVTGMVLWEAALLGLAGEAVGLAGGVALSAILVFVVNKQSFGWTFPYMTDWRAVALSLPLVLAAALAAGPPAIRAALSRRPALALRQR